MSRPLRIASNGFGRMGRLALRAGSGRPDLRFVRVRGDPHAAVIDALSTMVVNDTQVKVLGWYDNERGYANRLVELVALVGRPRSAGVPA